MSETVVGTVTPMKNFVKVFTVQFINIFQVALLYKSSFSVLTV